MIMLWQGRGQNTKAKRKYQDLLPYGGVASLAIVVETQSLEVHSS